jgi:hypothetical protein
MRVVATATCHEAASTQAGERDPRARTPSPCEPEAGRRGSGTGRQVCSGRRATRRPPGSNVEGPGTARGLQSALFVFGLALHGCALATRAPGGIEGTSPRSSLRDPGTRRRVRRSRPHQHNHGTAASSGQVGPPRSRRKRSPRPNAVGAHRRQDPRFPSASLLGRHGTCAPAGHAPWLPTDPPSKRRSRVTRGRDDASWAPQAATESTHRSPRFVW